MRRYVKDSNKPKRKDLMRPSFSPEFGCWIIDHVFNLYRPSRHDIWVFLVNINTRYCFATPVPNQSTEVTYEAVLKLREHLDSLEIENDSISAILGDGAAAYDQRDFTRLLTMLRIKYHFNSSAFTFHNKILDRCVRTIRDAIGYRRIVKLEEILYIIREYNYKKHKSIDCAPIEMMRNSDYEAQYIRYCEERLRKVLRNQHMLKLHNYNPGNVIFLHIDFSRTSNRFEKRRRFWNRIGIFIGYIHGNVNCHLLNENRSIVIPIYYTKYLCEDVEAIPQDVKTDYNIFFI
jgi:hypothetical protein